MRENRGTQIPYNVVRRVLQLHVPHNHIIQDTILLCQVLLLVLLRTVTI